MFVYLNKKIALPNNSKINCVQWNSETDWIAVGGAGGLLKIFKLESSIAKDNDKTNLSMNQVLEAHSGNVQLITWNEKFQKLTSCDDNGLIIVWTLHRGTWYEEMINNRQKSSVTGIAWTHDGQKICIVYEDGAVIVETVDGNRIWGKELKKLGLSGVQWSPNSKFILFAVRNGELHLYDDEGNFSMKLRMRCLPSVQIIVQVAGMHWYDGRNGYYSDDCPILAVVYHSGHVQLMRNQHDDDPVILDTGMAATNCRWNHNGSVLAIVGSIVLLGESKETNVVQFFSPFGEHIRTLKLPGSSISDCSWDADSLKIAIAIDSHLYLANIRPSYKWCYFSNTIVFSSPVRYRHETSIIFWDIKNNERYKKIVKSLLSVAAFKDHCVLATETDDCVAQYALTVCNNMTTAIDCKFMDLKPLFVSMNSTHVFAASRENFIMWPYTTPRSHSFSIKIAGSKHRKERLYHVDDTPSGVAEVIQDLDKNFEEVTISEPTKDPICCMACSDKTLLVGRRSGTIQRYTLPQVALIQRLVCSSRPQSLAINCNSSKLSVIDCTGALSLMTLRKDVLKENYNLTKDEGGAANRKDVWDMRWASDDAHYLAVMEKNWMYVLKDGSPEEPINSSAYIADFENLEIKAVQLEELMKTSNSTPCTDYVLDFEVKSLRDTRQLLQKVGIVEATLFVEKNSHPRLWRLIAEAALEKMDLSAAEMAYVRRNDYLGVQLIKKLSNLQNDDLKRALVESYLNNFDEAEKLYLKSDRRDLAIELRKKLGDWFRVVELMKTGSTTSDSQLTDAWNNIGEFFMDRMKWDAAKEYFLKASNYEKLIACYQYLEDYGGLKSCSVLLPERDPLFEKIGEIFYNGGMCSQAVDAYLKLGEARLAVEICVKLNQWDRALQLAAQHSVNVPVNQLIDTQANQLLQKGRLLDTVQLYRKCERYLEAAELLFELVERYPSRRLTPVALKKIYVLVAFLVEDHVSKVGRTRAAAGRGKMTSADFDSLRNTKLLDNPWYHAEAYHLLMMSQRQLINGDTETALRTSIRLRQYNDVLEPRQIYSVIAVCAVSCRAFETASNAFTELETLETECRNDYENMVVRLFRENEPQDPIDKFVTCSNCSTKIPLWNLKCQNCNIQPIISMGTGQIIPTMNDAWQCNACKHFTQYSDMVSRNSCPLCHSPTTL